MYKICQILCCLLLCLAIVPVYGQDGPKPKCQKKQKLQKAQKAQRTTDIPLANGQVWDIHDVTDGDCGAVCDGDDDAFDDWGHSAVQVKDADDNLLSEDEHLEGFNLTWDGNRRWNTLTPLVRGGISIQRALYAPDGTNYIRYIETFTNTTNELRKVLFSWGGDLGSDSSTLVYATDSGDTLIGTNDAWAVTVDDKVYTDDPPVAYALQLSGFIRQGTGDFEDNPFVTPFRGDGHDGLGFNYQINLLPGQTWSLAYFLYQGQYDSNVTEIEAARVWAINMVAAPDFADLTADEIKRIVNWRTDRIDNQEHNGKESCGATGFEFLLFLLVLAWQRRARKNRC